MYKIYYFLFIFVSTFLTSCNATGKSKHRIPTKAFVKVFKTIEVLKCKKKKKCPIGRWVSTGSGISVNIRKNTNIVLTAGHICTDIVPKSINISDYNMLLHVIDYNKVVHQAHMIFSSLDNTTGDVDACALFVPSFSGSKVNISKTAPTVGDKIFSMGAPAGIYHPPTVLILEGIYSGQIDASSSLVSIPAMGGSSGSGVLNKKFQLIGILYAVNKEFRHAAIVTNYNSTINFIQNVNLLLEKKSNPKKKK